MIRVLVVDDHLPTRQQIVRDLTTGGQIQVLAEAETSHEAFKIAEKLLPEIVLLDLHLPGLLNTFDLIKKLVGLRNVKVIVFASQGKASDVQDLLDAGASGYILKTDPSALIRMSILMVFRGSKHIVSPSLPRHLTELTGQERQILREITQRGQLPRAAERMGISEEELMELVVPLAEKLELLNAEGLVRWAKKHGF